jgi:hypothetical protein
MSTPCPPSDDAVQVPPPSHFAERADAGDEHWIEDAIEAYLDLTLGPKQREICRSVVNHERTAVVGANGTGKTYVTGAIVLAWQNVRYPAISFGTSGTGKKLYRTLCRPIDKLQDQANGGVGLPGEFKRQPPRIDYQDPEHFFEAATPKDAGELEGAHSAYTLAIVEETDKPDVTDATIDAMRSLIPDYETSRMLAVGNPPEDEANVFADMIADRSNWNVVRVSSFDSHNVLVETGKAEGEAIDGMATVSALREDWAGYHDVDWPGLEQAERWSDPDHEAFREDLNERWYRRRAGIMPPGDASVHRPLHPQVVESAYNPSATPARETPDTLGIDVARSSDDTVAVGRHDNHLVVEYEAQGTDHTEQEQRLAEQIRDWPPLEIAGDAVGEGSGLIDNLNDRFGDVTRFKNQATAVADTEYDDRWSESLAHFADYLEGSGRISNKDLYEQAKVAARTVTWEKRFIGRRGSDGEDVLSATPKEEVKKRLGRSPDHLDAALMAVWTARTDNTRGTKPVRRRSGGSPSTGSL